MRFPLQTLGRKTRKFFSLLYLLATGIFISNCSAQKEVIDNHSSMNPIAVSDTTKKPPIDWDQFAVDLKYYQDSTTLPIHPGVFPTYVYESEGNGSLFFETIIHGQHFVGRSVFVYSGDYNKTLFAGNTDESMVYFTVLVRTDVKADNDVMVSSRNHPVYVGEGSIRTEGPMVDWVAIQPAHTAGSALVNMRYFDFTAGRLVIVCPQQDKSLRFLQIQTPFLSDATLQTYIKENSTSESWEQFVGEN